MILGFVFTKHVNGHDLWRELLEPINQDKKRINEHLIKFHYQEMTNSMGATLAVLCCDNFAEHKMLCISIPTLALAWSSSAN